MDAERCVFCNKIIPEGTWVCRKCNEIEEQEDIMELTVIKLNTTTDVTDFVALCSKCIDDVSVHSERWIVSGKSLMGMFSLNLDKPLNVEFYGDIPYEVKEGMKKFIVN